MARVAATQRRRDFVAATVRVIAEHGVAGATTRRIAEEAGAALAALHYCFRSKEDLFLAVYEEQVSHLNHHVLAGSPQATDLGGAAVAVLEASIEWFRQHPAWARTQVELTLWALRQPGGHLAATAYDLHLAAVEPFLRQSLAPDDDESLVVPTARLIATLVDGLVLQWFAFADDERLVAGAGHAAEVLRLFAAGAHRTAPGRR